MNATNDDAIYSAVNEWHGMKYEADCLNLDCGVINAINLTVWGTIGGMVQLLYFPFSVIANPCYRKAKCCMKTKWTIYIMGLVALAVACV